MTESIRQNVYDIVVDLFNVPADEVGPDSSPATISQWDSLQHLNLVLAVEQVFGIQLSPEDIEKMTSVGKVIQIVEQKGRRTG
jgi:acyl carrier protein